MVMAIILSLLLFDEMKYTLMRRELAIGWPDFPNIFFS